MDSRLCTGVAALAIASAVCLSAQTLPQPAPQSGLDAGRAFTAQLHLDQRADEPLFTSIGYDRAVALLQPVLDQGQQPSATADDWKNMHRAVDGLTELNLWQRQTFKAALYQFLQNNFYMNLDRDYARALDAARRALALQQQSGVTATLYLDHSAVGHDLAELGRSDEALPELAAAHQSDPEPTTASGSLRWRDLVQAQIAVGHPNDAQQEVSSFQKAAEPAGGLARARALLAGADLSLARGNIDDAVDRIAEAQPLVTDDAEKAAFTMDAVYESMVCVLESLNHASYPQAIEIGNRIAAKIHGLPVNIPAFARQAVLARRRIAGDLDGVLRDQSSDLDAARASGNVPAQIEALRAMAVTYGALHARQQRVAVLEEARALETAQLPANGMPANYPAAYSMVTTLNSLGDAYNDLEDERAAAIFRYSLKLVDAVTAASDRQHLDPLASEARIGLARAAEIDQDPDSARDLLQDELKLHPNSSSTLLTWARLERNEREEFGKAAELYDQAVKQFHAQGVARNEITVRLEYARFLVSDAAGKIPDAIAKAKSQVEAAAPLVGGDEDAENTWQLAYTQGMIAEATGRNADAISSYRHAVEELSAVRSRIADESQRQAFADSKLEQDLFSRLAGLLAESQSTAEAWKVLEQQKARSFVEMLAGHQGSQQPASSPEWTEVRNIRDQLVNLRADLTGSALLALRGSGRSPAALEAQLRTLESRYSVARDRAIIASPSSTPVEDARPVELERIRRLLPAKAALLEFGLLPGKLAAFVVTRDGVQLKTWPADATALRRDVQRLRRALQSPDSTTELDQATTELSQLVIAPIAGSIPAKVDRLVIVPAAELHEVPFQTLRMPAGEYLADRFAISYSPAASALASLGRNDRKHGTLLLAAIGDVSSEGMPPLPGTKHEVESIAQLEPGAKIIEQSQFTHDAALHALDQFDEVHFATHGILDQDAPLFSSLLTSPAQGQSSRLSLLELLDRRIRSRLVVMSACETGLGRMSAGDEITGLTRTFLTAGARVVVSSMWKVSDESTATLMQEFYRGMRSGMSPADAMRAAELKVRKQYPHPFYWAPFVVNGAI